MNFLTNIKNLFCCQRNYKSECLNNLEGVLQTRKFIKDVRNNDPDVYQEMEEYFLSKYQNNKTRVENRVRQLNGTLQAKQEELLTSYHAVERLSYPNYMSNSKWNRNQVVVNGLISLANGLKRKGQRTQLLEALQKENSLDTVNNFILANLLLGMKRSAPKKKKTHSQKHKEKLEKSMKRKLFKITKQKSPKKAKKPKQSKPTAALKGGTKRKGRKSGMLTRSRRKQQKN